MPDQMTEWGVGPRFTLYSAVYCIFIFGLTVYLSPMFKINLVPYRMLLWLGIIVIVLGIPFYIFALVSVMRAYKDGRLVTTGVYGMCRHPVYSAWLIFFIPGIALITNSWALLSAPFVMYFLAKALVDKEDIYLEEIFGQEYLSYKQSVPAFMPYGWLKRNP